MAHPSTEQQVLGTLIKNPKLLLQTDRYQIKAEDFQLPVYRYIFWAVDNLAKTATDSLAPYEIEQIILNSPSARATYETKNGKQLLIDAEGVPVGSFEALYNQFKKENLINDLDRSGFNVKNYYVENPQTRNELAIAESYAVATPSEILHGVEGDLLKIKSRYLLNDTMKTISVSEGLQEMLQNLEKSPEIGFPLQGAIFNHIVSGAIKGRFYLRSASSGTGKALPNSTVIPTPNGFKAVKDIVKGDYLYDAFGKPTKVLEVYPQGLQRVYEVVFKDGRKALCNDQHLWSFNTKGQKPYSIKRRSFFTETLREIIDNRSLKSGQGSVNNILVPQHYAVEKKEKEFFLHPYVLGLLLGDGSFREHNKNKAIQFSSESSELPRSIAEIMGWELKENIANNFTWYFGNSDGGNIWVSHALKDYPELINTYSNNKFIPEDYLNSSIKQRRDLLNGLLDSDGSVDERGRVRYTTNSEQLRDGVMELARSLGFFVSYRVDNHKETSTCWDIHIAGRPSDKVQLFRLKRKKERIVKWYNNGKRKESGEHNPIVEINDLGYEEEMTCFMVDNDEHLFLMNDYIVTHNTRSSVGDACHLAFPVRYNWQKGKWIRDGYNKKTMIIITEQDFDEIQKMAVAYLTGINESRIKKVQCSAHELKVIKEALYVFDHYKENLIIARVPSPSIELIKQLVREHVAFYGIEYVFYDYIFVSPSLLREFKGANLRNDEILLMFSDALKNLAVELDIFILSSTQVNANADSSNNIRNESAIAGSRAVINKADVGCIMARPTREEIALMKDFIDQYGVTPNIVTDIYKLRGGENTQTRVWSVVDLGTMQKKDLFVTNSRLETVDILFENVTFKLPEEEEKDILEVLHELS